MPSRSRQAAAGSGSRPDVDHRDGVPVAQQDAVSLAHIAGGHLPSAGDRQRPADRTATPGTDVDERAGAQRERGHHGHDPGSASRQDQRRATAASTSGAEHHAQDAGRPGQSDAGEAAGERRHLGDPGGRHPGEPDDQLAERRAPRAAPRRRGSRARWRRAQPVRRADWPGCRTAAASALSRTSTGWQASWAAVGTATASASDRGIHRASVRLSGPAEHQQPRGRENGQGETVVACQPRIVDEQHDHRERQRRDAVGGTSPGQADQQNDGHRCGPDHARARSDQRHEREQGRARHRDARAPPEPWPGRGGTRAR